MPVVGHRDLDGAGTDHPATVDRRQHHRVHQAGPAEGLARSSSIDRPGCPAHRSRWLASKAPNRLAKAGSSAGVDRDDLHRPI
jgi:hypothetical protein